MLRPLGSVPLEACGTCTASPTSQRKSRALRRQRRRRRRQSSIHGARRISFSYGSSKIPGHDFQTWHGRRSQARKCTCRKLPGCENCRRNAHPGVVLVLIIRTDVSVLTLFVLIWMPLLFLRASHHTLIVFENRNLFVYLVSSVPYLVTSAFIPLICSELNSSSSSSLSSAVRGRAVNDHQCCQAVKQLRTGCDLC